MPTDAIIRGPPILVVRQPALVLRGDGRGLDLRQGQAQAQAVEEIHHKREAAPQVPWRISRRLRVQERRREHQQWQTDCLRAKMELKSSMKATVQSAEVSLLDRIGGFSLEERLLPMAEPPTSLGSPALEARRPPFQERLGAGQRRSLSPSYVDREDGPQRKKAKHHLVQQTENGKGQEGRKRKTRRSKPNAHNIARAYARKVAKDNIFGERRLTGPVTTATAGSSSVNASHQTTTTTAAGFSVANASHRARTQRSDDEISLGDDYGDSE
ncbi:hypothetical protein C8F01DRAFT_1083744 [Mycena amicta]|nr:hypothetical protein C8F01DRAFT_1083744 [Mycena amicta]